MAEIDIGKSGLLSSQIIIGCMRLSDLTVSQTEEMIESALEAGINLFDHADIYAGGACEEIFGKALTAKPSLREKILLQSKCGIKSKDGHNFYDLSKDYILESVDGILKRLNTEYLDIFLLHRPDTLMEPDEIAEAFNTLYDTGKVREFGVCNMNAAQIELLQSATNHKLIVDQLQLSLARTGMIDSGILANVPADEVGQDASILEYCRLKNITIQTWSPLQYGWFAGTFLGNEKYPELNAKLDELAEKYNTVPGTIALAWILRHPAKMQALIGSSNRKRMLDYSKAMNIALTREEWYDLYVAAGNFMP